MFLLGAITIIGAALAGCKLWRDHSVPSINIKRDVGDNDLLLDNQWLALGSKVESPALTLLEQIKMCRDIIKTGVVSEKKPGHCFKLTFDSRPPILILGTSHVDINQDTFTNFFQKQLTENNVTKVYFELDFESFQNELECDIPDKLTGTVDYKLYQSLSKMDLKLTGFETITDQICMNQKDRSRSHVMEKLEKLIQYRSSRKYKTDHDFVKTLWLHGSRSLMFKFHGGSDREMQAVATRNNNWTARLNSESSTPDEVIAIIVGSAHLYQQTGLLTHYLEKGATVEILSDVWSTLPKHDDELLMDFIRFNLKECVERWHNKFMDTCMAAFVEPTAEAIAFFRSISAQWKNIPEPEIQWLKHGVALPEWTVKYIPQLEGYSRR